MVSARLDDVANFIPARLSWLLISLAALLCGEAGGRALRIGWRDRYNHSSPNCGWSEAAVAERSASGSAALMITLASAWRSRGLARRRAIFP